MPTRDFEVQANVIVTMTVTFGRRDGDGLCPLEDITEGDAIQAFNLSAMDAIRDAALDEGFEIWVSSLNVKEG